MGEKIWVFYMVLQGDEFGVDIWQDELWCFLGNINVWMWMICDDEIGWFYFGMGMLMSDYYGGYCYGDNFFVESFVVFDVKMGECQWYFQVVYYGFWDYDFLVVFMFVDFEVDGCKIEVVVVVIKQVFIYVFDCKIGEFVWLIEECKVLESFVEGEWIVLIQFFLMKLLLFDCQGFCEIDLIDLMFELKVEVFEIYRRVFGGFFFMLLIEEGWQEKEMVVQFLGQVGGVNWGGVVFDFIFGMFYVLLQIWFGGNVLLCLIVWQGLDCIFLFKFGVLVGLQGLLFVKLLWMCMMVIDFNVGEIVWQVLFG